MLHFISKLGRERGKALFTIVCLEADACDAKFSTPTLVATFAISHALPRHGRSVGGLTHCSIQTLISNLISHYSGSQLHSLLPWQEYSEDRDTSSTKHHTEFSTKNSTPEDRHRST